MQIKKLKDPPKMMNLTHVAHRTQLCYFLSYYNLGDVIHISPLIHTVLILYCIFDVYIIYIYSSSSYSALPIFVCLYILQYKKGIWYSIPS